MTQIINLIGYLGDDPELNTTPGDQKVCNFSVAVNDPRDAEVEGEDKPKPTWYRCAAWGKQAEACAQFLAKGKRVFVSGDLRIRGYADNDGMQAWSNDVNAHNVTFLSAAEGAEPGERQESKTEAPKRRAAAPKAGAAATT